MRIVGGRLGGRTLATPRDRAIRPTADRLRESLFNILVHGHGDPVAGARVLDLFAGTGALGIEAVSRGAAFALLVDEQRERGAARERFDAECTGAGEQVEHARAADRIAVGMHEDVEQRFAQPVRGRPDGFGFRRSEGAPAQGSADDPHRVFSSAAATDADRRRDPANAGVHAARA